jgi:predicted small lipoprotein YifL
VTRRAPLLLLSALAACGGGGTSTPLPDADLNAPLCTGAVFDNCSANEQCTSQNCHLFRQSGFQVCVPACDAANPCPNDASGAPATCNNMGICKPLQANACRAE